MRPLVAVFFLVAMLPAQQPRIVGPGGGGAMFHVTINPNNPQEVLLSCDMTGGYISHDGGHHWRMFSLRAGIQFFAFDPVHPRTIYAETDVLWRSTDDGTSWRVLWPRPSTIRAIRMDSDHADESVEAEPNPIGEITALAIDPADSRILYAASKKDTQAILNISRNGGITWQRLHFLPTTTLHIWIDPHSAKELRDLYVVSSDGTEARVHGQWIHYAGPQGSTFTDASAGFPAGDHAAPTLYAVAKDTQSNSSLLVSTDGGANWIPSPFPGDGTQLRAVTASLHHPNVAYASYKNMHLDGETLQGVARTDDSGKHWTVVWRSTADKEAANVHDAWIASEMTPRWTEEPLSLTVDDHDPNLAYATDLGRTLGTSDGGLNWSARYSEPTAKSAGKDASWISTGLDVTTTYGYLFDPFDSKRRFILTTDIGLFRSEDDGHSWIRSVTGAPAQWQNTTYSLVFDPQIRAKMWAAMSEIHDLPRPKMWRRASTSKYIGGICVSTDGGRTWQSSSVGMPPTAPTFILLDPASPAGHRRLWATTMGYGVFRSTDDGHTWSPVNEGIAQKNALAWRLALASDGTLYALIARRSEDGSIDNEGDGALYRSTDGGDHWSPVPLPAKANAPNGLAIDPGNPNRLYLALWARETPKVGSVKIAKPGRPAALNGKYGGIAVSSDAGHTWRWVLERDRHIYDVTIDPRDPAILYAAGFESSAWISHDHGEHWARIPGFNFKWGHRVQADMKDRNKVYISTFGGGVWHPPLPGPEVHDVATPALTP